MGDRIETGGGAYFKESIHTGGGHFAGRDLIVYNLAPEQRPSQEEALALLKRLPLADVPAPWQPAARQSSALSA